MPFTSWANPWTKPASDDGYRFNPLHLSPYAFYDANLGGSSTGITDSSYNARANMTVGGGSNSPLWLPYAAAAVYLPGAAGNYVSAPDAAALDITGDLEIVARLALTNWTTGNECILAKRETGQLSYQLATLATGTLQLGYSTDGTTFASVTSSAAVGFSAGQAGWVKVTRRQSDGRVQFFTAADAATEPSSWTQLGTDQTGTTSALWSGTARLEIGTNRAGTVNPANGSFYRAIVRSGISGTSVADFDASLCGQTGYTGPLGNVWTVNRATTGRKAVVQSPAANSAKSLFLLGTDDWLDVPAAAIPPLDTYAAASSVVTVFRRWHNPGAAGHAVFTTKASVANAVLGFTQRLDTTAASTILGARAGDGGTQSDGYDTAGAVTLALGARGVWYTQVGNASPYVSSQANNGTAGTDNVRATVSTTSTAGAGRVGAYLGGTGPIDMEFRALLTFNRALTGAEIAQLVAYYKGGM